MYFRWLLGFFFLISSLRAARIITYNTYHPKDPLYTALLLNPPLLCEHYNEALYDISSLDKSALDALKSQLQCNGTIPYVYVLSTHQTLCSIYNVVDGSTSFVKCKQDYPSLCTNSAPERTYETPPSRDPKFLHHVRSLYGRFKGTRTNVAFVFLGIPYAFPPINDLRFKSPVCIARIHKTWDASFFRSFCPQDETLIGKKPLNEDCLYLNVYTPYLPDGRDTKDMLLPVMFWIHGGSFVRGDPSGAIFDPSHFSSREKVVVVTVHYRLGALGFWAAGNQGIRDQLLALQWVNNYISMFGGDPERITIAGESAGANSVRALLSAHTKAKGLFSAAILASDILNLGYSTTKDSIDILSYQMARIVGCAAEGQSVTDANVMNCMRNVPVEKIIAVQDKVGTYAASKAKSITNSEFYTPTIDNDLIHEDFHVALTTGNFVKVPIMIGFLQHEGHFFIPYFFPTILGRGIFSLALSILFSPNEVKAIMESQLYDYYKNDVNTDNVRLALAEILTHSHWTCPTQLVISQLSKHTTVYPYYSSYPYTWLHPKGTFRHGYVCHADDVLSYMGGLRIPNIHKAYFSTDSNIIDTDAIYIRRFSERLAAFIRHHNPNPIQKELCYDKDDYNPSNEKTVYWNKFQVNNTLEEVDIKFGKTTKLKVFGALHVLDIPETTIWDGVNVTICKFWFKLGFHAHMHFDYNNDALKKKILRAIQSYKSY